MGMQRLFDPKKLFDWWSVPHFLFGMVMALFAIVFSLPLSYVLFMMFFLALLWEILEQRYILFEIPVNVMIDILLPFLSFGITSILVARADPDPERVSGLLIIVFLLYCVINFFAWRARFDRDREFLG